MTPPREESGRTDGGAAEEPVSFSVEIEDGETVITMRGDRDTAVVVRSASGERIYLPPEDFDRDAPGSREGRAGETDGSEGSEPDSPYQSAPTDSPYQSAPTDSPYQSVRTDSPYQSAPTDSPYQSAQTDSPYRGIEDDSPYGGSGEPTHGEGLSATADGYRIRHPEPVTDVRVLR
ncbi:DUF7510 family protein [Halobellus ruber]|uniref:Uncharacterized protein n=1 Tax=Halobellus ruber TaxID=2761102 RepID=A0A7J9SG90_9EURY|nr:hypothetical protein [Halobellus ruber]MBB6645403.1 hypothetical protein [Halobellus ruber]